MKKKLETGIAIVAVSGFIYVCARVIFEFFTG